MLPRGTQASAQLATSSGGRGPDRILSPTWNWKPRSKAASSRSLSKFSPILLERSSYASSATACFCERVAFKRGPHWSASKILAVVSSLNPKTFSSCRLCSPEAVYFM